MGNDMTFLWNANTKLQMLLLFGVVKNAPIIVAASWSFE